MAKSLTTKALGGGGPGNGYHSPVLIIDGLDKKWLSKPHSQIPDPEQTDNKPKIKPRSHCPISCLLELITN